MSMNKKLFYIISFAIFLIYGCNKNSKSNSISDNSKNMDSSYAENQATETQEAEEYDNSSDNETPSSNVVGPTLVESFEEESVSEDEANPFSWCSNFEPSDRDVPGQIVYEGSNDYYIIEDNYGYVIAESYSGWPSEGDQVYGNLNSFGFKWVVNTRAEKEYKFWIEDYGLSRDNAIRWMREHNHIK